MCDLFMKSNFEVSMPFTSGFHVSFQGSLSEGMWQKLYKDNYGKRQPPEPVDESGKPIVKKVELLGSRLLDGSKSGMTRMTVVMGCFQTPSLSHRHFFISDLSPVRCAAGGSIEMSTAWYSYLQQYAQHKVFVTTINHLSSLCFIHSPVWQLFFHNFGQVLFRQYIILLGRSHDMAAMLSRRGLQGPMTTMMRKFHHCRIQPANMAWSWRSRIAWRLILAGAMVVRRRCCQGSIRFHPLFGGWAMFQPQPFHPNTGGRVTFRSCLQRTLHQQIQY